MNSVVSYHCRKSAGNLLPREVCGKPNSENMQKCVTQEVLNVNSTLVILIRMCYKIDQPKACME
jgi:hypothetical protein